MENEFKNLTLSNCLEEVLKMEYGHINVVYSDDKARHETGIIIRTVNMVAGLEILREAPFMEETPTNEGWVETEVPGKYRIIYADRHNPVPAIGEDDLNVWSVIENASKDKTLHRLTLHPGLYKNVKKECRDIGVKYSIEGGQVVIDGRQKSLSVYKQMQKAYQDGKVNISFNLDEINMPTVRTYASQLSAAVMKKIRCSVDAGIITVHFREDHTEELKSILLKLSESFTRSEIMETINEFLGPVADLTSSVNVEVVPGGLRRTETPEEPIWQQMGFASELDYNVYQERKKADIEAWTNNPVSEATNSNGQPLPPGVDIVDGLPQYVMEIPEEETESAMPEDYDF